MAKIGINYVACTHSRSVSSECNRCVETCHYEALKMDGQLLLLDNDRCVSCFACISACPTQAVNSSKVDILGFTGKFLDSNDNRVSCRQTEFCLSAFDVQTFLTILAFKKDGIMISIGDCEACEFDSRIKNSIIETVGVVNDYAKSLGLDSRIGTTVDTPETQKVEPVKDRRSFFKAFNSKNIISVAREINEQSKTDEHTVVFGDGYVELDEIRSKKLPSNREGLLAVLDMFNISQEHGLNPIFSTDKIIDDGCINCELCYNLCPTGALSGTRLKNAINFESYKCIKCALCESVCETKSIHSMPMFDIFNFAKKNTKELKTFKIARCVDCGIVFAAIIQNDGVCPRCSKEDEDAMDLSGFFTNSNN